MSVSRSLFIDRLKQSGLASQLLLDGCDAAWQAKDGNALAEDLVEARLLTRFQSRILLEGDVSVPLRIGEYEVLDQIGRGGMGRVVKARHRSMNRLAAIKLLLPQYSSSTELRSRFEREVRAVAQLEHPNIVAAYDAGTADDESLFLVMRYVDGQDLAIKVREEGVLSVPAAVDVITQAASGLAHAHAKGLVHRDIKPANLIQDSEGTVRVLDLGLASFRKTLADDSHADLTSPGNVLGTVDYMAPEQAADSRSIDHRADIYSLGCSLFFLLTGRPPYGGDSSIRRMMAHRESEIPVLADVRPDIPPELERIYLTLLAKNPDDRYQSMAEVIAALSVLDFDDALAPSAVETVDMPDDGSGGFVTLSDDDSGESSAADEQTEFEPSSANWCQGPRVMASAAVGSTTDGNCGDASNDRTLANPLAPTTQLLQGNSHTPDKQLTQGRSSTLVTSRSELPKKILIAASAVAGLGILVAAFQGSGSGTAESEQRLQTADASPVSSADNVPTTRFDSEPALETEVQYGLQFDGKATGVLVDSLFYDGSHPITIEAIATPAAAENGPLISVNHIVLATDGYRWHTAFAGRDNSDEFHLRFNRLIDGFAVKETAYLAATLDDQQIQIFLNGRSTTWPMRRRTLPEETWIEVDDFGKSSPIDYQESTWLGRMPPASDAPSFYSGVIHELRISNVVRRPSEFQLRRRFENDADTIALYHFDEGSGDVLHDSSGNEYHGKIDGAVWVRFGPLQFPQALKDSVE